MTTLMGFQRLILKRVVRAGDGKNKLKLVAISGIQIGINHYTGADRK